MKIKNKIACNIFFVSQIRNLINKKILQETLELFCELAVHHNQQYFIYTNIRLGN